MTDLKSLLIRALSDARSAGSDDAQTASLLMARMMAARVGAVERKIENERLREALKDARAFMDACGPDPDEDDHETNALIEGAKSRADAALKETSHD